MATEVTIKDNVYSIGTLSGRQQFHVSRRIAPALFGMMKGATNAAGLTEDLRKLASFEPLVEVLAGMPDEQADYVLDTCLSVVKRQVKANGGNVAWADIFNTQARALQYTDIDMPVMMQLAWAVIQANMGDFIGGLLGNREGASPGIKAVN